MKIFISQPMRGFTPDEIIVERRRIANLFSHNEIVNPYDPSLKDEKPLVALGESIKLMAEADMIVCPTDCWDYTGCYIESEIARRYNIPFCAINMYPDRRRDMMPVMEGVVEPNA